MRTEPVDPRDVTSEEQRPAYRVYFWSRTDGPADVPLDRRGFVCREFRVLDARDVHEVVAWAEDGDRADETFTLHVEHRTPDGGTGLALLAGTDPTMA